LDTCDLPSLHVEEKMVMETLLIQKHIDECQIVIGEATCSEWIWKVADRHCVVVDTKLLVDIQFILFYLF
jgi:hypothetical protein